MFHNGEKRRPLNCIFYCGWPVQVDITETNFFTESLDTLASIFIFYTAASILSICSWNNAGYFVSFNSGTAYKLNMSILIPFIIKLYLNIGIIKKLFTTNLFSVFYVDGIFLMHVMTFSELSASSAWIICFTSFVSFAKLLTLHSKIVNPFDKYYSDILLGNFNMTT